jgi:hypothetical protein
VKAILEQKSIRDLVDLNKNRLLLANPEYQRGVVWSEPQKKKLIDSIFRGYPLPVIYLHHLKRVVAGITQEGFEIIDGQQRLTAISNFVEGAFPLFDPIVDRMKARFPVYVESEPCPWGGKYFEQLDVSEKEQLLETEITVAMIETDNANEVRDLFIRLQSGSALNAQETRDAMPGGFTDFILRLGGKPQLLKPGHDYFLKVMGAKPGSDRGKTRQMAAQIAMIILSRNRDGAIQTDLNSRAVNQYYYDRLDFDIDGDEAERVRIVLDLLARVLGDGKRAKLRAHDTLHAALLVDSLHKVYAPEWQDRFANAIDTFMSRLALAKKGGEDGEWYHYWTNYGQWTRVNSDRSETLQKRHNFYVKEMRELLAPLVMKDHTRAFGELDRQILYHLQEKKCAVCSGDVVWEDAEIHHIVEHQKGGETTLSNGAMVHRVCHPKGTQATSAFESSFLAENPR